MTKPVCLITGVGPGTGLALAKRFAGEYQVAMLARNSDRLHSWAREIPETFAYPCDVADAAALIETVGRVQRDLGAPEVVLHNAVGGAFGDFLQIEPAVLQANFQVNTMALLHLAQMMAPAMVQQGRGAILCTGNTAAYRGVASFAGFAPTKAAQRILCESMARALWPKGVHVAYVAIDAVIDVPWTRQRFADRPDDFFCRPQDIAEQCWQVVHQPRSAWNFDVVIRPFGEKW